MTIERPPQLPASMRAAFIEAPGPAESIRYGSLPVPTPGPTDVLVKVGAVTVDPVDTFIRSRAFPTSMPLPFIVGRDLAGTVVAVGVGAAGFAVGDRVWEASLGHDGRQGSFAEYAVVPAERLYHLPDDADPVQAVGLAHMAATAYLGLFRRARLLPGETVFIAGGGGNIGAAALRMAVDAGARVIVSASGADLARCESAGAAAVVDFRDPHADDGVRAAAPDGIDVYWDTSGHHDFARAVRLTARGGRILLTAARHGDTPPLPVSAAYTKDISLLGFVISHARVDELAAAARVINGYLRRGTLTARIADTLPLARTAEAHRRVEAGGVHGRIILTP